MVVMWSLLSCKTESKFDLQSIPITVYVDSQDKPFTRQDLGYHFNHQRGFNYVKLETPRDMGIIQLDSSYKPVDYHWYLKFNNWFARLQHDNGIQAIDQGENHDCDNFAMLYKSLASVAGYKSGTSMEPACALLVVRQHEPFGGVPGSGGLHMLNLVLTNNGWYVFEPQTGEHVLLQDYPNEKHIQYFIM
jgi:hypothetical protein